MAQAQPLSTSADGVWHHLRLAPGLARPTQPVADGAPAALVVQQGVLRWIGPQQALPAAFAALPQHDARGAWATPHSLAIVQCRPRASSSRPCSWLTCNSSHNPGPADSIANVVWQEGPAEKHENFDEGCLTAVKYPEVDGTQHSRRDTNKQRAKCDHKKVHSSCDDRFPIYDQSFVQKVDQCVEKNNRHAVVQQRFTKNQDENCICVVHSHIAQYTECRDWINR